MSTVTTTKKKKVVYRQDPDGVFRLKKVGEEEKESPEKKKKKKAAGANELHDLSYKVFGLEEPKEAVQEAPHEAVHEAPHEAAPENVVSCPDSELDEAPSIKKKNTQPPPLHSDNDKSETPKLQSPYSQFKSSVLQMVATKNDQVFHAPSFAIGMGVATVIYRYREPLFIIAIGIVGLVGVLAVFALIAGTAFYYLGLLKVEDLNEFAIWRQQFMSKITGKQKEVHDVNEEKETVHPKESVHPKENVHVHDNDHHVPDNHSLQEVAEIEEAIASARMWREALDNHSDNRSIHTSKTHKSAEDAVPPVSAPQERRNTYTRVTPFKHTYSTDDVMGRKPPALNRSQSQRERELPRKVEMKKDRHVYKVHNPPGSKKGSVDLKQLPPHPREAEELPFINEVKLITGDEFDPYDRVGRSNSKRSVLGTRQGYNMFMANVEGDD